MNCDVSWKWRGREVETLMGRVGVSILAVIGIALGLLGAIIMVPLAALLHLPLRALGRRGSFRTGDGNIVIALDREAFRRA